MNRARIRSLAASLLLAQKPRSFFALGLLDLRRFRGEFLIDTLEAFAAQSRAPLPISPMPDGMTLIVPNGKPLILYAAALEHHRRNWTLAHEMGHLLLGHRAPGQVCEREADAFASALLMPPVVIAAWEELHGCRMREEELCRAFPVSRTAARRCRAELDAHCSVPFGSEERRLAQELFAAHAWRDEDAF